MTRGLAGRAEIGALRRVEQVPAGTVTGSAGRRVPQRQEQATAVSIQPPHRYARADGLPERDPANLLESGHAIRAGVGFAREPLRPRRPAQRGQVHRSAGSSARSARHATGSHRGRRRAARALWVRAHHLIPAVPPQRVRGRWIRLLADPGVQRGVLPPPVPASCKASSGFMSATVDSFSYTYRQAVGCSRK